MEAAVGDVLRLFAADVSIVERSGKRMSGHHSCKDLNK